MSHFDPIQIRRALKQLAAARSKIFGADWHGLELNPPLSEAELAAFEQRHLVSLPPDYRKFLKEVGNGGAGPFYGVFPLGHMDGNGGDLVPWDKFGLVGSLSEPFPHREAWNDLTGMPQVDDLNGANDEQMASFEEHYWNARRINGAIPICHMGCALRIWLVVLGEQAGRLWRDGRADFSGIAPILNKDGSPAAFASWYLQWLDDCMHVLED